MAGERFDDSEERRQRLIEFVTGCLLRARYTIGMSNGITLPPEILQQALRPERQSSPVNLSTINRPLPSYGYFIRRQASCLDIADLEYMRADQHLTVEKAFDIVELQGPPTDIVDKYE